MLAIQKSLGHEHQGTQQLKITQVVGNLIRDELGEIGQQLLQAWVFAKMFQRRAYHFAVHCRGGGGGRGRRGAVLFDSGGYFLVVQLQLLG